MAPGSIRGLVLTTLLVEVLQQFALELVARCTGERMGLRSRFVMKG